MKLSTSSHIQRLFDDSNVVALTETHLFLDETPLHMPGFQCLHNPHPVFNMSSIRAVVKHSGGVAVFVNDSWSDYVPMETEHRWHQVVVAVLALRGCIVVFGYSVCSTQRVPIC
jgi:hypothetical protein